MINKALLEQTVSLFGESTSYYINKNKVKSWSDKATVQDKKIVSRIKIKAVEVNPHLTDLQTKRLIKLVDTMKAKNYNVVMDEINDLDTVSREVLFSVMDEK